MQFITNEENSLLRPGSLVVVKNHTLITGIKQKIFTIARVLENDQHSDDTERFTQRTLYPEEPIIKLKLETAGGGIIQYGEFTLFLSETIILQENFRGSAPRYLRHCKKKILSLRKKIKSNL